MTELPVTQRLMLRPFVPGDLDFLITLNANPEVVRFTGGPKNRNETKTMLHERILDYYKRYPGLGVWVTQEKLSGKSIGMHLLNHIRGEAFIQVGYILLPEYWGYGYATEMSTALLRYGFTVLGLKQIVGITDLANLGSQRVLLKSGLKRQGERSFSHPSYATQGLLAWFERDVSDWLAEYAASV